MYNMNMKPLIYVCEDEKVILDTICSFLKANEYDAQGFMSAHECFEVFKEKPCDCLITDVNMPTMNGFELIQKVRTVSNVPIIVLTARDADLDYALGIHLGADDYITKPFSTLNLMMRVKALLRRVQLDLSQQNQEKVTFHTLFMDPKTREATAKGVNLDLTPMEFAVLLYLTRHADQAISREILLKKVWGYETLVETRACDDTIRRLRKKLIDSGITIETIWGYGFRVIETQL
jgi:DNA-binding response OmpR family regulator